MPIITHSIFAGVKYCHFSLRKKINNFKGNLQNIFFQLNLNLAKFNTFLFAHTAF